MSHSYRDLLNMDTDALIAEHDRLASHTHTGINYYLDELRRRDNERLGNEMNGLTVQIASMTKRIERLTWVAVVASLISVAIAIFK